MLPALAAAAGAALLLAAALARPTESGAAAAARGGTLRIDLPGDFDFVDPNLAYTGFSWQLLNGLCATLYRYPDVDGRAGTRLVPGTAATFPKTSHGGRQVVITVRPRYARFWTGAPVTARSYANALQRGLDPSMQSPVVGHLREVIGANAVLARKASQARGIRVRGNRLIINVMEPVPDLAARLAMPLFCPQPGAKGLPREPKGIDAPFNGGGPYVLREWTRDRAAIVQRNPHWRGAIARTRPANVNRIEYTLRVAPATAKLRLDRDQTDLAPILPPPVWGEIAERYGLNRGRFFVRKVMTTWFLVFNHDRPLFGPKGSGAGNVALKRAINFAVDRPALARQFGYLAGARTDQLLPSTMPGFRNWDIYPIRGADPARAQRLAQGHTRGGKLVFYTFSVGAGPGIGEVLKQSLRTIGLDVEVRPFLPPVMIERIGKRGEPFDMALLGWQADYPDPATFVRQLLSRTSILDDNGTNLAYFDSRRFERLFQRAAAVSGPRRYAAFANVER